MNIITALITSLVLTTGLFAQSITEQKNSINEDRLTTLKMLYKAFPSSQENIKKAYGYATFNNVGINIILFSAEGGSGVAVDNKTGKKHYMNMASGGLGFGLGVKDFRAVFVFKNKKVFNSFVENGWEANAQIDAAAKAGKKGGALEGAITVQPGIQLYKLTQSGLALQATIQGTKYWKDSDLN